MFEGDVAARATELVRGWPPLTPVQRALVQSLLAREVRS